jgi:hypothetical protein
MAAFQFSYPDIPMPDGGTPAYQAHVLDATADSLAIVFRAQDNMTVTSVSFRQGTVTGGPDALRVGVQGVNATNGLANGVWNGGVSNFASLTVVGANNNTFVTATLPSSINLVQGEIAALVLQPVSGGGGGNGWDGGDNMTVSRTIANVAYGLRGPYAVDNGVKSTNQNCVYKLNTSTRSYGLPIETITSRSVGTGTSPAINEWGMRFRIPTTVCSTYKISGVRISGVASAGDWQMRLYDTDGTTVLQTVFVDKDEVSMGTAYSTNLYWEDGALATLNAGSYYRIAFAPTTATATGAIYAWDLDTANDRLCFVGNADDISATERRNPGAWTETDTRIWAMQALIVDVTAPTGSAGGMLVHPGMSGGMRG